MMKIGVSAELTFRKIGGFGRFFDNCPAAALIAAWMSWAAASILRLRSNCTMMLAKPRALVDVIWVTPEICANWRSNGVETEDAIVSGLAPGRVAETRMVGKSTWGSWEIGSAGYEIRPASRIA